MYDEDERLDEEYAAYLDEFCRCNLDEDECECIKFEAWLGEKMLAYEESLFGIA